MSDCYCVKDIGIILVNEIFPFLWSTVNLIILKNDYDYLFIYYDFFLFYDNYFFR